MVTGNGDARYMPHSGDDNNGVTPVSSARRRAARPPPLALMPGYEPAPDQASSSSRHPSRAPSPCPSNSARQRPHPRSRSRPRSRSPHLHPVPPTQERIFLPPGSPQFRPGPESSGTGPPLPSPTLPETISKWHSKDPIGGADPERPPHPHRKPPPRAPSLRISKSTSKLNTRHHHSKYPNNGYYLSSDPRQHNDVASSALGLPRASSNGSSGTHGVDNLRSSANSTVTSRSSTEQASGTERSSVLTKASSITDLSPDTPDGPYDDYDDEGGMSVEDAIGMYLDGFSDVPEEPTSPDPETESRTQPLGSQERKELLTDDEEEHERDNHGGHSPDERSLVSKPVDPPDPPDPPKKPEPSAPSSSNIINTDNTSSEPLPLHPTAGIRPSMEHLPANQQQKSAVILPGVVPPPLLRGTGARDRYGFRKATNHVTIEQYETWNGSYSNISAQRKAKWVELLRENSLPTVNPATFPLKSSRVKRFVRKGIPSEFRGAAWFWYAGGYDVMKQNPGHFEKLVRTAMHSPNNDDKEHIERDLHRTFPDNLHFKPDTAKKTEGNRSDSSGSNDSEPESTVETKMIQSLRRVLYAFALHNPKVGYTQSLNFIAGLLLLFLPEENAFWMLHIVTSEYLPGTHEISLEGANIDLWILMVLLRESFPNIYSKIASSTPRAARSKPPTITVNSRLPDITLGLTNWLMSLFIGTLPLETTLRVWDVLFYEGSKTFFRVSLAIFKACERDILAVSDPMEVFQVIQTVPKRLLDANALMEECFARKLRVGQSRVEDLRVLRRTAVRQEKMRRSAAGKRGLLEEELDERPTTSRLRTPIPGLDRSIADSWRHMKSHAFG